MPAVLRRIRDQQCRIARYIEPVSVGLISTIVMLARGSQCGTVPWEYDSLQFTVIALVTICVMNSIHCEHLLMCRTVSMCCYGLCCWRDDASLLCGLCCGWLFPFFPPEHGDTCTDWQMRERGDMNSAVDVDIVMETDDVVGQPCNFENTLRYPPRNGGSCWINASLQCLYASASIRQYLAQYFADHCDRI